MSQPESADDAASLTTDKDTDRRGQLDQLRATVAPCDPHETVEEWRKRVGLGNSVNGLLPAG
jgi:hypothetical protein